MTTSQVSLNSINSNPAYTNPYAKTDQPAATAQIKQDAQKSTQTSKTDTVTISQQALQMVGNNDNGAKDQKDGTTKQADGATGGIKYPGMK